MIRVRTTNGKSYTMNDSARFIELCNEDGEVGVIVFMKDDGVVQIIHPNEEEFANYIKSYNLKSTTVTNINV